MRHRRKIRKSILYIILFTSETGRLLYADNFCTNRQITLQRKYEIIIIKKKKKQSRKGSEFDWIRDDRNKYFEFGDRGDPYFYRNRPLLGFCSHSIGHTD